MAFPKVLLQPVGISILSDSSGSMLPIHTDQMDRHRLCRLELDSTYVH